MVCEDIKFRTSLEPPADKIVIYVCYEYVADIKCKFVTTIRAKDVSRIYMI